MHRHDLDTLSLVTGLIFTAIGAAVLLDLTPGVHLPIRWLAPVVLLVVGAIGLLASRRRMTATSPAYDELALDQELGRS